MSKTKHVAFRFFYVKQVVDSGRAEIIYLQTDKMGADILTKVLIGTPFRIGASACLTELPFVVVIVIVIVSFTPS